MPVDYTGFTLKPVGFFDRNPTLDIPASSAACDTSSSCDTSDSAATDDSPCHG